MQNQINGKHSDRDNNTEACQTSNCSRYTKAVALARKGRYEEASELLRQAVEAGECQEAEAYDLRARIYAQQGQYLHAESCWLKAQSLDSSNPVYDDALSRLRQQRRSPVNFNKALVFLGFLIIFSLLLKQVFWGTPELHRRQDATDQLISSLQSEVNLFEDGSQLQNLKIETDLSAIYKDILSYRSNLSRQLRAMPTLSEASKNRDAIIKSVDEEIAEVNTAILKQMNEKIRALRSYASAS